MMDKKDAIYHLLYMKHDVQAKSPMDIAIDTAIEALKHPTIEPEVRHGRWIEESAYEYYCSYCGKYAPIAKNMRHCDCSKWCKECGTKMDGGADNG